MSLRAGALALALSVAGGVALGTVGAADGAPNAQQTFFRTKLLADAKVGDEVRDLLEGGGGGQVDRSVVFRDLTGDDRTDAIVRVQSRSAAGAVGVYVFTTDGSAKRSQLRLVFRRESLRRARTEVHDGNLLIIGARYTEGDTLEAPSALEEQTVRWSKAKRRFSAGGIREVPREEEDPDAAPAPGRTTR